MSGRLHVAIGGGFEGDVTAELARMQALQEEALLLQHWSAIQLVQPLCNSHNVFPANQLMLLWEVLCMRATLM